MLLVAVVAAAGCKGDKLKWKAQALTAFQIGSVSIAIPTGWRDLSEAADPSLANLTMRLGADTEAHILVREGDVNTDTNISIMLADLVGAPTCEQWVSTMNQEGGPKIDASTARERTFGPDRGCSFYFTDGPSVEGRMFLRFRGAKFITLQCMRPAKGDANADATCEALATQLEK